MTDIFEKEGKHYLYCQLRILAKRFLSNQKCVCVRVCVCVPVWCVCACVCACDCLLIKKMKRIKRREASVLWVHLESAALIFWNSLTNLTITVNASSALNDPVLTDVASLVFFLNTISPVIAILASLAMLAPLLIHLAVEGRDSGRRILGDFFSVQNQFCQSS